MRNFKAGRYHCHGEIDHAATVCFEETVYRRLPRHIEGLWGLDLSREGPPRAKLSERIGLPPSKHKSWSAGWPIKYSARLQAGPFGRLSGGAAIPICGLWVVMRWRHRVEHRRASDGFPVLRLHSWHRAVRDRCQGADLPPLRYSPSGGIEARPVRGPPRRR